MTEDARPARTSHGPSWQRLYPVAVAIVLAYLAFAVVAFIRADDAVDDVLWGRSAWVLQGVQAIAFTAVGWLFGREVHRGEAEQAKERAADAKEEADEARFDAKEATSRAEAAKDETGEVRERAIVAEQSGLRLADAVRHASARGETEEDGGDERGRDRPTSDVNELKRLRDLADSLFPPH